jgi:hypothetical protein
LGPPAPPSRRARDDAGGVHELVRIQDAYEHVKKGKGRDVFAFGELANMVAKNGPETETDTEREQERARREREDELADATGDAIVAELVAAVEKKGLKGKKVLLAFLVALEGMTDEDQIAQRRGLQTDDSPGLVQRIAASMSENQLAALLVEIAQNTWDGKARDAFCAAFDIDQAAIMNRVAEDLEAKATKPTKGKKAKVANV